MTDLPVALDAMGGDKAPDEIVAGAHRAVEELGVPVALVGQPEVLGPIAGDLEVIPASEVIGMSGDFIQRNCAASCWLEPLISGTRSVRPARAALTG